MALTVRNKSAWQRFEDGKMHGYGVVSVGQVFHVYPGTSATHLAYIRDRNRYSYSSVSAALADCVAGRGDTIVCYPGTHSITASLAMSKSHVNIVGAAEFFQSPLLGQATLDSTGLADELMNITAADITIQGVTIIGTTQQKAIDFSAAANRLTLRRVTIDMATPAVHVNTKGVVALGAASNILIEDCYVFCDGAQGVAFDMTATVDSYINRLRVMHSAGTWAAVILTGAATSGFVMQNSEIDSYGTAITAAVDGTGASIARGCKFKYCNFGNLCTVPIDNYDANEAELVECYKQGVGAMDGGTKLTAIT